ncbi:MAG: YwbE family protein [Methanomicrobiaceae archaeon]|uniref:YwbE family protein n=1 Tax=hydrocarbon metagenome TaxID=938273 RepID=A0A0W8FHH7_9ZZZZ|nr:YwbE family protein [Methanomicrobiaceae archaeon]MDD5418539.1 YwbE family protein [Methanomicrobiaceae archaeon]
MNGRYRKEIRPGLEVEIVQKRDQRTGRRTRGVVMDILTNSSFHPQGIKVRLADGRIGRVQAIVGS